MKYVEATKLKNQMVDELNEGRIQSLSLVWDMFDLYSSLFSEELRKVLILSVADALSQATIKKPKEWAEKNASYFYGNCVGNEGWKKTFGSGEYDLESLVSFTKEIAKDPTSNAIIYWLRNPSVTLRDDVSFPNFSTESLKQQGRAYADTLNYVFNKIDARAI